MVFLVIWLEMVIASFGMEMASELKLFKDVADAGYKIDTKRLAELQEQLYPGETNAILLSMLIPIFNVMKVFERMMQYNNARPIILSQLNVLDALEEMSEVEKMEYLKNPTGLNALIVPLKLEKRLEKATSIKINDDNEHGEIYYEKGKSLDDITILKVSGSVSRLTAEEQKKKIIEAQRNASQEEIKKYSDAETLTDSNSNIDSSDSKKYKKDEKTISLTPQESSVSEQKQMLENLKKKILEEQETIQSAKTDKGPTLSKTKRRK